MAPIRVILAEDNALLREGIAKLVASQADLEVVGVAGDLPSLLALVDSIEADVVVTSNGSSADFQERKSVTDRCRMYIGDLSPVAAPA